MDTWNQNIYNAENQNIQITHKNTKSIKYFINDKYEALINFDLNKISKYNPGRNYKIQAIELVYIFDKKLCLKITFDPFGEVLIDLENNDAFLIHPFKKHKKVNYIDNTNNDVIKQYEINKLDINKEKSKKH